MSKILIKSTVVYKEFTIFFYGKFILVFPQATKMKVPR